MDVMRPSGDVKLITHAVAHPQPNPNPVFCKRGILKCIKNALIPGSFDATKIEVTRHLYGEILADPLGKSADIDLLVTEMKQLHQTKEEIKNVLDDITAKAVWQLQFQDKVSKGTKLIIQKDRLTFSEFLGGGAYGRVYKLSHAIVNKKEETHLVMKKLYDNDLAEFNRELLALHVTGMLVKAYPEHSILLQKEVKGKPLDVLIDEAMTTSTDPTILSRYKASYDKLAHQFYETYGLFHGDIRPGNVMVQADGTMQLIDFGRTTSVLEIIQEKSKIKAMLSSSAFDPTALKHLNDFHRRSPNAIQNPKVIKKLKGETEIAQNEWDYILLRNDALMILQGKKAGSPEKVEKYEQVYRERYRQDLPPIEQHMIREYYIQYARQLISN
jgi:hypothetical protein